MKNTLGLICIALCQLWPPLGSKIVHTWKEIGDSNWINWNRLPHLSQMRIKRSSAPISFLFIQVASNGLPCLKLGHKLFVWRVVKLCIGQLPSIIISDTISCIISLIKFLPSLSETSLSVIALVSASSSLNFTNSSLSFSFICNKSIRSIG